MAQQRLPTQGLLTSRYQREHDKSTESGGGISQHKLNTVYATQQQHRAAILDSLQKISDRCAAVDAQCNSLSQEPRELALENSIRKCIRSLPEVAISAAWPPTTRRSTSRHAVLAIASTCRAGAGSQTCLLRSGGHSELLICVAHLAFGVLCAGARQAEPDRHVPAGF